ncbi:hypothetical protein LZ023_40560 (plasmid) [Pseudomonas silvicola]|nr:hypothetical protein LZ023_40560 [Pseudomonas silvicola]
MTTLIREKPDAVASSCAIGVTIAGTPLAVSTKLSSETSVLSTAKLPNKRDRRAAR